MERHGMTVSRYLDGKCDRISNSPSWCEDRSPSLWRSSGGGGHGRNFPVPSSESIDRGLKEKLKSDTLKIRIDLEVHS